jgi:hypothetical protein
MRLVIAVVALLLATAPLHALAADPPGGPGWYELTTTQIVPTSSGDLVIAGGTPGLLVGVATNGFLRLRFERGVATWLGREITSDGGFALTLTVEVDPAFVRAFVKQNLSSAAPGARRGGAEPGALGALGGGGITTGAGVGGTQGVNVQRDTTVTVEDRLNLVRAPAPAAAAVPDQRGGGAGVLPPAGSTVGGGAGGGATRTIAREEHDAWLLKVLRLLGEDGARCETKGYGPGWVSICEPSAA